MQLFFFFSCLADLLILLYVITKACSREQIIKGLREISNGNLQYKIPLKRLWGDDKHIAEYINNIGSGLDAAVENSVKNERIERADHQRFPRSEDPADFHYQLR